MSAPDPIARFSEEYARAEGLEAFDASRCALATADADGRPSVRFVLLKGFDDRGFVFYTNYESHKSHDIDANPHAALAFHWHTTGVQFRVRGSVERVSDAESDAYFATRDRGSQIGAWASKQSQPLADRTVLDVQVSKVQKRFQHVSVTRPPFWGGFRIIPEVIELWKNRDDRLHDRWRYQRVSGSWIEERLYP